MLGFIWALNIFPEAFIFGASFSEIDVGSAGIGKLQGFDHCMLKSLLMLISTIGDIFSTVLCLEAS